MFRWLAERSMKIGAKNAFIERNIHKTKLEREIVAH